MSNKELQFQVNGRNLDANDVRVVVDIGDGYSLVVLLGADGIEHYGVGPDGDVIETGGVDYSQLADNYWDLAGYPVKK